MKKNSLLEIAKEAALEALDSLELNNDKELISNYDEDLIREMKSEIDVINNEIILSKLKKQIYLFYLKKALPMLITKTIFGLLIH